MWEKIETLSNQEFISIFAREETITSQDSEGDIRFGFNIKEKGGRNCGFDLRGMSKGRLFRFQIPLLHKLETYIEVNRFRRGP